MPRLLALSPYDRVSRPVDLPAAELAEIVAELETYPDFPTPVRGRCALCSGPLAAVEADRTGVAHRLCAADVLNEIELDIDDGYRRR